MWSVEWGAGSVERGAGSAEVGAGSVERGAGSGRKRLRTRQRLLHSGSPIALFRTSNLIISTHLCHFQSPLYVNGLNSFLSALRTPTSALRTQFSSPYSFTFLCSVLRLIPSFAAALVCT